MKSPGPARAALVGRGVLAVLAVLVAVVLGAAALAVYQGGREAPPPPAAELPLRERPRVIRSRATDPGLVPKADLVRVLQGLEPFWSTRYFGDLLHALRLWGPDAVFPPTSPLAVPPGATPANSREMLEYYLDEAAFRRRFPVEEPYFARTPHGVLTREGHSAPAANLHHDDFLALAGELGLPTGTALTWGGQTFTLADLLKTSAAWYPGPELEFTAVAYALYLPAGATWTNRFGETYGFDDLAGRLVRNPLEGGACCSTHVPYALAVLLAADEQDHVLSAGVRAEVENRLKEMSRELAERQSAAGWWDRHWFPARANAPLAEPELDDWVRCTGHHLEWFALVGPELRPPAESVKRAVGFLRQVMRRVEPRMLAPAKRYGPYSHAGRALHLIAGYETAVEVMAGDWARRKGGSN